jgi:CBS domain-containing protein
MLSFFVFGKSELSATLLVSVICGVLILALMFFRSLQNEKARRFAEEELKNLRERYQAVVETSADGTVLILDDKFIYANLVFLAMTGYTSRQFLDLSFSEIFHDTTDNHIDAGNLINDLERSGTTVTIEVRIRHKRGDFRDAIMTLSKIDYEQKEGMILVIKDVTRKERIKKETSTLADELQASILLMNLPVTSFLRNHIRCAMDQTVEDAAVMMRRKKQDAVLITRDDRDYIGIITDADLRNRVVAQRFDLSRQVFEIMSSPLITIPQTSLLFEAQLIIKDKSISHLAVTNERGEVIGIISKEDLMEVQRNTISYIVKEIQDAESVDVLKKVHERVPGLVKTLLESGAKMQNVTYMISTITDSITERLINFAIEDMGQPPAKFAFITLGSEGRREQTMTTDQDNAIIFEDVPNDQVGAVNKYFLYLGKKINEWLNKVGYDYCEGEIMAGNPQWCQPLSRWQKYFTDWINNSSPESLLGVSIFFDFRVVYGEAKYGDELRTQINKTVRKKNKFFQHLVMNVQTYKPPLNLLRPQLPDSRAGYQDFIDLKVAIRPFIEFVRIYAVKNEMSETGTLQRLEKLLIRRIIEKNDYDEISHSYNTLMEIRFRMQLEKILSNKLPDNYAKPQELTEIEKSLLRKILAGVSDYQSRLALEFRETTKK